MFRLWRDVILLELYDAVFALMARNVYFYGARFFLALPHLTLFTKIRLAQNLVLSGSRKAIGNIMRHESMEHYLHSFKDFCQRFSLN